MKSQRRNRRCEKLLTALATACLVGGCPKSEERVEDEADKPDARPRPAPADPSTQSATADAPKRDEKAEALVRSMSDYLAGLSAFSMQVDHTTEIVTHAGEKIEFGARSEVVVDRPDKLRSDRKGELADLSLYYDGKTITIFGRRANMYATKDAPPTLDAAIDFARSELGLEAPGADLLYSDPYAVLMEDVESSRYVGQAEVGGVRCHHLAFRNTQTDWQLWIADDPAAPLPCKYVVTSKDIEGMPEFSVVLRDWNTDPDAPEAMFTPALPEGAVRVEFFERDEKESPGEVQHG